jgi:hypothetical protein
MRPFTGGLNGATGRTLISISTVELHADEEAA